MVVAVACNGHNVPTHFNHATSLTFYHIDRGIVLGSRSMPLSDAPASRQSRILGELGAYALICCGTDAHTHRALDEQGVEVFFCTDPSPLEAVRTFLRETFLGTAELV
ncbi:hypothetical protein HLV37_06920 [Eggerthellaceae bacterium zg-1084]|uniref:Dinitrogenase iron-molybdenum cofactor biosynthesis domain-containing protein n=1 Tax=Berryella wangjianweii TaxID=2734634 RepID=A0A6M8J2G9_9ACTN|nr:NifB/NifX family molybdenum-iron cluster-binding protein [Berryella wangjianweii]NPD31581.1 hypothetical protein [Berryella wangjianweii]NPD32924.1 hypothetical protein [Eggerthellaceae bacterium zg-997]QKF07797.1 hypothetical protein HLV38_06500 [Berryella wangjianweii]